MCEQSKRQEQLSLTCFSFYFFSHGAEFSPQNLGQKVGKFIVFSKGCLEAGINSFLTFLKFYNLRFFILHLCKAAVQFWLNNKKTLFSQKAQTFNFNVDRTYQWRPGDATLDYHSLNLCSSQSKLRRTFLMNMTCHWFHIMKTVKRLTIRSLKLPSWLMTEFLVFQNLALDAGPVQKRSKEKFLFILHLPFGLGHSLSVLLIAKT